MKKYLIYICMLWGIVISCNDDDNLPKISPKDSGEWTDSRDNTTYGWIRLGNLDWMTSNLKYGSPYYENEYGGPLMDNYGNPGVLFHGMPILISNPIIKNTVTCILGKKH